MGAKRSGGGGINGKHPNFQLTILWDFSVGAPSTLCAENQPPPPIKNHVPFSVLLFPQLRVTYLFILLYLYSSTCVGQL